MARARQRERTEPTFIEAARRAQIVDAAIETLVDLGYPRTSLAEIAKRAGISKGVISYHFAGKDDLMEQVVVDIYTRGAYEMVPAMAAETTARGMLLAYIRSNVAFVATNPRAMRALMEIFPNHRDAEGKLKFDQSGNAPIIEDLEYVLRVGQDSGEFRDFSPRVMAAAVRGAIDALPMLFDRGLLPSDEAADELVELFDQATRSANPPAKPLVDVQDRMRQFGEQKMREGKVPPPPPGFSVESLGQS